jgi:hypothetical protein
MDSTRWMTDLMHRGPNAGTQAHVRIDSQSRPQQRGLVVSDSRRSELYGCRSRHTTSGYAKEEAASLADPRKETAPRQAVPAPSIGTRTQLRCATQAIARKIRRSAAVALIRDDWATANRHRAYGGQLQTQGGLRPVRQGRFTGAPRPNCAQNRLTRARRESEQLAPIGVGSHNVG